MRILIQPFAKQLRSGKENAKNYPYWKELLSKLYEEVIQIGVEGEEQLVQDFRKNLSFKEIEKLINECDFFISVDTMLQHLAWYNNKKGIVIFSKSDPLIFGHSENINLLKDRKYLRKNQFDTWENEEYNKEAFISPEEVIEVIKKHEHPLAS